MQICMSGRVALWQNGWCYIYVGIKHVQYQVCMRRCRHYRGQVGRQVFRAVYQNSHAMRMGRREYEIGFCGPWALR